MIKEDFLKEVKAELIHIRDNATSEEIGRLKFNRFNRSNRHQCIYGQMTGDCDSARACRLSPKRYDDIGSGFGFEKQDFSEGNDFTALEKYLFMCSKEQHRLIYRFLQKKDSDITLTIK